MIADRAKDQLEADEAREVAGAAEARPSPRISRRLLLATLAVVVLLFLEYVAKRIRYERSLERSWLILRHREEVPEDFRAFRDEVEKVRSRTIFSLRGPVEDFYGRCLYLPSPDEQGLDLLAKMGRPRALRGAGRFRRVLCLGSSVTEGGYARHLQSELDGRVPGTWEVLNGGISGAFDYNLLQNFALSWSELRPQVVVIECNVNEPALALVPFRFSEALLRFRDPTERWRRGRFHDRPFALAVLLNEYFRARVSWTRFEDPPLRDARDRYRSILNALISIVRGNGGRVVLLTHPTALGPGGARHGFTPEERARIVAFYMAIYPELSLDAILELLAEQNESMARIAKRRHCLLVDMRGKLERSSLHYEDGNHLTSVGGRRVAQEVAATLAALEGRGGGRR